MNKKLFGMVMIIVGIALAMWGYDVYDSAGSQVSRALSGDTPIEAWFGLGGGVLCILLGLSRLK
ncbi:MAG: DUF3185 family protein [Paraglaciecola sp.]|jgi:uncharacterized membrane protein YidH (DUF202 family)|nr:DUF3185 family protein [Paraglaciecola sp.]NCT49215.1 DUF3185 family protein [Paraglaciecola sp.]